MRTQTRDEELQVLADVLAESLTHVGQCELRNRDADKGKVCSCRMQERQDEALYAYRAWKKKQPA